ncbi:MAG TPA: hypothetical protein VGK64_14340 [Bryobacteraceae bacterium]
MRAAYLGVVATVVLSHAVLAEDKSSYALPKPTGQFFVGRTVEWWTDHARREQATLEGNERELQAIIYYPANGAGKHAAYYPGLTGLGGMSETKLLARHFGSAWAAVEGGLVQSNAYADAPFSKNLGKCPVLVFSPGGSAPVLAYSAQLEELASHGYVAVGLNHPHDTALIIRPDHRLIPFVDQSPQQSGPPSVAGLQADLEVVRRWTADTKFALDQLEIASRKKHGILFKHLNLSRIGVLGHSLGGKAAARLCQIDHRVKACLNEDGELFGIPFGSNQPVPSVIPGRRMRAPFVDIYVAERLASDAQLAAVHVTREQFEGWRRSKTEALRAFLRSNVRDSYLVVIRRPGFTHGGFMDIAELGAVVARTSKSTAQSNLELANDLTLAFFDAMLKHDNGNWRQLVMNPPEAVSIESFGKRHIQ